MASYLVIPPGQAVVNSLISLGEIVLTCTRDNSKIQSKALLDTTDFEAAHEVLKKSSPIDGLLIVQVLYY